MRHCQAAVRLDLVARNVADNAEPPKSEDREVEILKASDVPAVLDALKVLASCWVKVAPNLAPDYQMQGIINRDHVDSNTPNFLIKTYR
jgi:hypothetical protein